MQPKNPPMSWMVSLVLQEHKRLVASELGKNANTKMYLCCRHALPKSRTCAGGTSREDTTYRVSLAKELSI
jgi:predicted nucleic acid binding AN1-type Zn finger protein